MPQFNNKLGTIFVGEELHEHVEVSVKTCFQNKYCCATLYLVIKCFQFF